VYRGFSDFQQGLIKRPNVTLHLAPTNWLQS
jgi:hypothetical protein